MKLSFSGRKFLFPSGASYLQLTLAMLWGGWLGLTPTLATLHTGILLFCLIFIRLPIVLLALSACCCWLLGWLGGDHLIDYLGGYLLKLDVLRTVWTSLYNLPVFPWTRFNNSMVLGAFVLGVLLLPLWIFLAGMMKRNQVVPAEK